MMIITPTNHSFASSTISLNFTWLLNRRPDEIGECCRRTRTLQSNAPPNFPLTTANKTGRKLVIHQNGTRIECAKVRNTLLTFE